MKLTTKQNLLIIQMGSVVPRSAGGYVDDLSQSPSATESFVADRLSQLRRHCPELVDQFVREMELQRD